ncbi:MAG: tetratricopeptide repeat protein [Candidatus Acidiferrum sp.]
MTYASSVRIARRGFSVAALVVVVAAGAGCSKLKARDLLNKGVANFKNGQYDKAVEDFKEAKDLDPSLMNARLYLATAYASQYIPGAPSEENVKRGNAAIDEFKGVLEKDPNNLSAIDGIGSILFQMSGQPFNPAKFQESKTYHQKHIELKPNDPEPYYWIGVIDWTLAFRANAELRTAYNKDHINKQIKEGDALPAAVRTDYVAKDGQMVDEGITYLQKAITIKPDYDDAMAYLNLLYRRKADMVESADERVSFQKQADALVDKVKEIKQKRAEQPQQPT